MENSFNSQYIQNHIQTDDNSSISYKNDNTFPNLEINDYNKNSNDCNIQRIFNNFKDKEDISLNNFENDEIIYLIQNKKTKRAVNKKQATGKSLTRKDNMQRLCKHLLLETLRDFINKKIEFVYGGNIGNGLLKKELLKIEQKQKLDYHSDFNKIFLNKTIKDIFSEKITNKITYFEKDHNKKLIDELIRDKGDEFERLFNLTFIECLEHFSGVNYRIELEGLKLFNEHKENIINKYSKNDESFYYNLESFIKDYRRRINCSNSKKVKKAKN